MTNKQKLPNTTETEPTKIMKEMVQSKIMLSVFMLLVLNKCLKKNKLTMNPKKAGKKRKIPNSPNRLSTNPIILLRRVVLSIPDQFNRVPPEHFTPVVRRAGVDAAAVGEEILVHVEVGLDWAFRHHVLLHAFHRVAAEQTDRASLGEELFRVA